MPHLHRVLSASFAGTLLASAVPAAAHAAYPGVNGPLLYGEYVVKGKRQDVYRGDLKLAALDGTSLGSRFASKQDEEDGTVAPTGTQMAFVRADRIWLGDADGAGAQRVTTANQEEFSPQFSPDGRTLAFANYRDGIVTVNVDGTTTTTPRVIVRARSTFGKRVVRWTVLSRPRFTADGTKLLFLRSDYRAPTEAPDDVYTSNGTSLWFAKADGTAPRRLVRATGALREIWDFDISPDGQRIAITSSAGLRKRPRAVSLVGIDGSGAHRIAGPSTGGAEINGLAWSPDGTSLVLAQNAPSLEAGGRLDVLELASGARRTIATSRNAWIGSPAWLPAPSTS